MRIAVAFLSGALLMLGLLFLGADDYALPVVRVETDARPFRCEGIELELTADDPGDDQSPVSESMVLEPDLVCQIRFWVVNDSTRAREVDLVVMPFLGGQSGAGIRATNLTPWRSGGGTYFGPTPPLDESAGYAFEVLSSALAIRESMNGSASAKPSSGSVTLSRARSLGRVITPNKPSLRAKGCFGSRRVIRIKI